MAARVNLYFLASPLQHLAAIRIAEEFEPGATNIALPYKPGARDAVTTEAWDTVEYVPWPRFEPLPGLFGKIRRNLDNLRRVESLIPPCQELCIHTAVLDTEAINYYVNFLKSRFPAAGVSVRILPDGLVSTRRYPLSPIKRMAQCVKKLRRLTTPSLNYYCYAGDRCGTDAGIVDRIYVLPGFPHEYPKAKVQRLPALVSARAEVGQSAEKRALVIGQPLVGAGLLAKKDLEALTGEIRDWLAAAGAKQVLYKAHPKDPNAELCAPQYQKVDTSEALESWLVNEHFDWVVGARSTALLMARQLCARDSQVHAFGFDRLIFKSPEEKQSITQTFRDAGVEPVGDS